MIDRLCGLGCGRHIACLKLDRRQVVQTRVRRDFTEWRRQVSVTATASWRLRNHFMLRHSSRSSPLKLSSVAFCHGLPGSLRTQWIPAAVGPAELHARRTPGRCRS